MNSTSDRINYDIHQEPQGHCALNFDLSTGAMEVFFPREIGDTPPKVHIHEDFSAADSLRKDDVDDVDDVFA